MLSIHVNVLNFESLLRFGQGLFNGHGSKLWLLSLPLSFQHDLPPIFFSTATPVPSSVFLPTDKGNRHEFSWNFLSHSDLTYVCM